MKKYWFLLLLLPFLSVLSCMDDTSAYLPQDKEEVDVDKGFGIDTTNTDSVLPEGKLVPGIHLVTLKVLEGEKLVERRFKYFMPVTLTTKKPISLIFDFHGSHDFEKPSEVPDPLSGLSESNPLCQKAIKENCIICFPAGVAEFQADSTGAVNWAGDGYMKSLPFVDEMVKYFTVDNEPHADRNRIYSTGQSSGAIFSFCLALHRSEVFAAITPRAGQSASTEPLPARAVPVRVFAGEADDIVNHDALLGNMTKWAVNIGGYFASDVKVDTAVYEGYADITIRSWHGGYADYEIYSLAGIGHNVSAAYCIDDMWDFMRTHTLDNAANRLFVTTSVKEINAQCGEAFEIGVSYTKGAEIEIDAPQSWNPQFDGEKLSLTAPKDFFGNVSRDGVITFTVMQEGKDEVVYELPYHLNAPKPYFEVGDIYYNADFEPIGVVYWVNQANIKEARIIGLEEHKFGRLGVGSTFEAPDMEDGVANTAKYVEAGLTAANSAAVKAAEYSYKGEENWFLPAINELVAINANKAKLNEALVAAGGKAINMSYCLSSTVTLSNGKQTFYEFNFNYGTISKETGMYADPCRVCKVVTKK